MDPVLVEEKAQDARFSCAVSDDKTMCAFQKGFGGSFKASEIDPTGAGDSFGGAFIVGYLAGWDLKKAAKFANAVGALKVEFFGPMPETNYEEVISLLEKA